MAGGRWWRTACRFWADPAGRPNWLQSNYDFRFNLAVNLLIAGRAGVKVLSRVDGAPWEVISVPSHLVYIHPLSDRWPVSDTRIRAAVGGCV